MRRPFRRPRGSSIRHTRGRRLQPTKAARTVEPGIDCAGIRLAVSASEHEQPLDHRGVGIEERARVTVGGLVLATLARLCHDPFRVRGLVEIGRTLLTPCGCRLTGPTEDRGEPGDLARSAH